MYGVKLVNALREHNSYDEVVNQFQFASATQSMVSRLIPKEFMNIYPIEKDYKGYKCEMKDYFYTRVYINMFDQDKPIGKNITEFLWGYHNWDINFFNLAIIGRMSNIRSFEGKPSIAEEWADKNGLETSEMHTDEKGNKFMINKEGKT